ncbi:pyruvate dehydrogenase (acetyl-transferring), homodimeric type [Aeromicrobium wangtongii]|uniref:Pyruvate dehydrogenase E1 component n=1 Tax=Aeromicrobium wangtongii TaxID=2969247 RepID=A0ABY5MCJ7_9ACTN|nr:pyruvate dehydrogenase (acetyl-transferring), homodimeric type [Aeromicrobium wangtongii]MCD9197402.1 pyruvate dehydrogenase (acetyl-transferring), homodimeric type [Aeromicrobium wangtongii]MCL3818329.1 pyruvate dehydrogenase (acetyl-transferring), homodimeric type [Aeromicrobium wangtongii]UUP14896.1 pyruvate dehydrogenase (acetyl-transferring), homodimeric type [Aeromicrobium wangtongii]
MPQSGQERPTVIHEGLPTQLPDIDPDETAEWVSSLDEMVDSRGRGRARYVMLKLLERAREQNVGVPALLSTDFINTIPPEREPWFPGNEAIERRIRSYIRWNAAVMVSRANRPGLGVGGHIASYQSAASLYEVGFNHFFRGKNHPGGGDQIYFQGHAAPGIYARSFLEGRLSETQLDRFRQEHSHGAGNGLSSYPHPRLMSDYWEFPTVSMGLGAINAIYQARFNRYLHNRGIKDTSQQHVWAFLGDGEMGEVESLGAIGVAAREELDNLTFVVNCNLQQLDGPVRGNGKIIQELESTFRGAGWNVIKVVWGREWDDLLARDTDGVLVNQMNRTPDGEFQTLSVETGAYNREHFFGPDPRLRKMVEHLSDEEIERLPRGGHDYRKVYAAFEAAQKHTGQPTVILAHTVKGWLLESFAGRNATHQMKKLTKDDLKGFRDRLNIPVTDEQIDGSDIAPFYHPGEDSEEMQYMKARREALGGSLPQRIVNPTTVKLPDPAIYEELKKGSGKQQIATTMAFVRLLRDLMKDPEIGRRIVPIAPDEYRTFGMDSMFPSAKIYNPAGQTYESVDRKLLLAYKESAQGQLLHEGISEAGAMASAIAAGSAYSTHGEPMIPVYLFYSMFGFQRTADSIWAMADQLARGFLIGATAGRTTLTGEGLQHADGHSPLIAQTNPAVVHYDPAFSFEISHIVKQGLERMYGTSDAFPHGEDIIYYLTVYNEAFNQPVEPEDVDVEGLLKGAYVYRKATGDGIAARIMASGIAVPWALKAQEILAADYGVAADVWSVTSWNELARDAIAAEQWNLNHPGQYSKVPYITGKLMDSSAVTVAVSDYMRAVPDQIARWVPGPWQSLGTDGFGFADTRAAARRTFQVDAESIVVSVLQTLAQAGSVAAETAHEAFTRFRIDDPTAVAGVEQVGGDA